jgi:hypothetical protein
MELLEADYTTTNVTVTVPATTGTVGVPTTADTIEKITRPLHCLWNASATGTINDNDAAPTVATIILLLRLPKEVLLCLNSA